VTGSDPPLVSVVLPTDDRDDYLAEAIDSVLDQTHDRLELLVVDGQPDDSTRALVRNRVDGAVPFEHIPQQGEGAGAARNLGIEAATGEFVAFLDDDDRWRPETVERQLRAFREGGPGVGVVYVGATYPGSVEERSDFQPDIEGDVTRALLRGNFVGSFSRVMVRATTVETVGGIDEQFPTWEDWEWFLRLSRVCAFRAVPEPLVVRRGGHGDQLSHDIEVTYRESYPLFLETFRPLAAEYGDDIERTFIGAVSYRLGWAALWRERYDIARRTLFRAVRADPTSWQYPVVFALAVAGPFGRALYGLVPDALTGRAGALLRRWT